MSNFITKTLAKLFGTKSERDLKTLLPYVEKVNDVYKSLANLSDDDLRNKTATLKEEIASKLKDIDAQITALQQKADESIDIDILEKELIFAQIDDLEKERNKKLEEVLLEILPTAFAVVKETARRYKENEKLVVTATMLDKQIAAVKSNVEIQGEKAIWHNKWLAAGTEIVWDMVHYDVQIIGGVVLHQGKIAEMATGEGKTLVATFPAFLNALAGRGVHIVTVNDYLARRDSEWMAPLMEFHGLAVDCIDKHQPNSEARRKAYRADIIYGTNNEFGFDYLRDNMSQTTDELVQRKLHYAMVDEVDSVLIDDARTPLIISGPAVQGSDEEEYAQLKPFVARLVEEQKKLTNNFLVEAKKKIEEGNDKEGGVALFRAHRGLPKYKPLIKYLSEMGKKAILQKTENHYLQDNAKQMPEADAPLYFVIEEKNNSVELTEKGINLINSYVNDDTFFIMPDIGVEIAQIENNHSLSLEERAKTKEILITDYTIKSQRIHSVNQLLKAYALFEKDTEYIIVDGEIKIVDEQRGRVMEGRRYSDGLHQALEAKEGVKIEGATQTYATVTLQNYFRMYHKLAGMTGTAETEAGEFWEIYKLDVVVIPTNRSITRADREDMVFKTVREKYNAVVDEIVGLVEKGRPVLVGTTSVENSEILSRMLTLRKIKHQVLNAKRHQHEAEIVAEAGKAGTVTIATNMAGRGTDIKLSAEAKAAGGLAIIGTERHEARRVDRQLRGRAGRQGDPGSSQFFVSLEDSLMRLFGSDRIARIMDRLGLKEGEVIQHSMITRSIERAQKKVEENNFGIRKRLLEYDNIMNAQREIIYKRRRSALFGERLELDIYNMMYDICETMLTDMQGPGNYENFKLKAIAILGVEPQLTEQEFNTGKPEELAQHLFRQAENHYKEKIKKMAQESYPVFKNIQQEKGATVKDVVVPIGDNRRSMHVMTDLQKAVATEGQELINSIQKAAGLALIDQEWKEHLRDMDDLKQSVQNAVFEQKDPLMVYKFEAFGIFKHFMNKVNEDTISFLMKMELPRENAGVREEQARTKKNTSSPKLKLSKDEAQSVLSSSNGNSQMQAAMQQQTQEIQKTAPLKSDKIANKNDRVSVQYMDGTVKRDIKYKIVEEDIKSNKCVLID